MHLPASPTRKQHITFLQAFAEIHVAMAMVNNGLKPKEGEVTSQPWQWPINYRGQRFTRWGDHNLRVYLLGNSVVYWSMLVCFAVLLLASLVLLAMNKRSIEV